MTTPTPWRKTIRDFRQESARTLLVVVAIAIGITGFAAVLSAYAVLTREINKGYLATNPASATLQTDAIDDALMTVVLADHDVSDAEPRRTVEGSIKTGPVEWRDLLLFVIKDYGNIRLSKLVPEKGAWPPATGEVLIERDAFQVARVKIGDTITIKIGRKEHTLQVSGGVHDVGLPQARMENSVYGYITLDTLARLGERPYLNQLNILVAENRFDENHIREVAADVKKLVEARGHPVRQVDIPQPGKHPHNDLMVALLVIMSSFGLFVVAMSGILVVNLLMAIMASQVRQIGMMKAIGGTRGQVARIYFGQAMLLGIAATAVALPLGMLASRLLGGTFAKLLNFDITSFAVPLWVYALVFAVGLLVPLLAAAWPISKGSAISVREALASYGASRSAFGTSAFDRAIAAVGGTFRPLLLAVRNSFRRRTRLVLTLVTLAASGLFFMSALNIRGSTIKTFDRIFAAKKYALVVFLEDMYPAERIERALRQTPGVVRAESWFTSGASIPNSIAGSGSLDGIHFQLIAVPAGSQMIKLQIVEGRDLVSGDEDAIVISNALAEKSRLKSGDTVTVRIGQVPTSWHVVGISREGFFSTVAYVPQEFADQRLHHAGMRNSVYLALQKTDPVSIYALTAALDHNLEQEGIRASGSRSQIGLRASVDQHILMIYVFLVVMSGIILAVGGLGLATSMSLNVMERRREMGVLRVTGASPAVVMGIVAAEGMVIGLMSWILAGLAAGPLSRFAGNSLMAVLFKSKMDFVFDLQGLWIWLAVSVFFSATASLLPARSAVKLTVREALAYE
jgi:putative ABC transport system permease protein